MSDDNHTKSQADLPFAAGSMPQRLSDRVARVTGDGDLGVPVQSADSPPLHKMHDGRVVRPAGRMIVGSRAPAPLSGAIEPGNAMMEHPQLFSSAREGKPRLSGGAAVAVVCAVAVGATAALTAAVNSGGDRAGVSEADQRVSARTRGGEVQRAAVLQHGTTQVAAISPATVAPPQMAADVSQPNLIRVANQDVPGLVIDNIVGPAGVPIPVKITITLADSEEYSFLMFRGLPENLSLSAGFRLKDSWAVSLRDLQKLALVSPPGYEGAFKLEVLLVKGRNTPVESRVVAVRLGGGLPAPAAEEAVASLPREVREPVSTSRILTSTPPEAEPRVQQIEPERLPQQPALAPRPAAPSNKLTISPEAEATMLDRATRLLQTGDVSSARLLFEHIAKKGSGKAALALGQTFDPIFLRTMNTLGLKADPAKAKEWYTIAVQLGQREAKERLSALTTR